MTWEPIGTLDAIPAWAVPSICNGCGDAIFGSQGSRWSSDDPDHHYHTDCERAAEYVQHLSVIDTLRHQALIEVNEILWTLAQECDGANWNDEVGRSVFAAMAAADRGYAAPYTAQKPHEVRA